MSKRIKKNKDGTKKNLDNHLAPKFDYPSEVSLYFGFSPIKTPTIKKEDIDASRSFSMEQDGSSPLSCVCEEKFAILRTYLKNEMHSLPQPVMLEYKKPLRGMKQKKHGENHVGLEIIGVSSAAAEALAIRTACSILEDEGYENLELRINSIGDKDSILAFEKNLHNYVRKNISSMPTELQKLVKQDVFNLTRNTREEWSKWTDGAPKSISFLTDHSRNHLKEALEFIETLGFPYHISSNLIGNPKFCSHIIFEITTETNSGPQLVAHGYRYERISKRAGLKKETPALGLSVFYKPIKNKSKLRPLPKAKYCLIQVGFAAKLKVLNVIELLRKAKIAVAYSIFKDKLSSQILSAENLKVSHLILIGQKEALEDAVVVRDINTRVQETIPAEKLAYHLKSLK